MDHFIRPWCVVVYPDGTFKYAKPRNGRIAWSIDDWLTLDRAAAEQYLVPDDQHRSTQQAFRAACGL